MADGQKDEVKSNTQINGWHALIVLIAMGGLVSIVAVVIGTFKEGGDAASVLGTVIPSISAIGAAAFGIPLAYQSGKAGKEEAVKESNREGKKEGKRAFGRHVQNVMSDMSKLTERSADAATLAATLNAKLVALLAED